MKTTVLLVSISSLCLFCAAKPVEKAAEEKEQAPAAQDKSSQESQSYFLQREEALAASLNAGGQKSDKHKRYVIDVRTMSHDSFPFMDERSDEEQDEQAQEEDSYEGRLRRESEAQPATESVNTTQAAPASELDDTLAKAAQLSGVTEHKKPTPGISYSGRRRRDSESQSTPAPESPATTTEAAQPSELDETLAKAAQLSGVTEHKKPTPGISYSGRRRRDSESQSTPAPESPATTTEAAQPSELDETLAKAAQLSGVTEHKKPTPGISYSGRRRRDSESQSKSAPESPSDTVEAAQPSELDDTLAKAAQLSGVTEHKKPTPGISYSGRRRRDSESQSTPAPESPATTTEAAQPSELDETLAKAAQLSGVTEHKKPTPGISYSGRRRRDSESQSKSAPESPSDTVEAAQPSELDDTLAKAAQLSGVTEHKKPTPGISYSGRRRRDSESQSTPAPESPATTTEAAQPSELDETLAKAAHLSGVTEHKKPTPGISYSGRRRRDSESQSTPAPESPATTTEAAQPSELDDTLAKAAQLSGVTEHKKPTPGISYSGRRRRSVDAQNVPVNPDVDEVFTAPISMTGLDGEQSFRAGSVHFKRSAESSEDEEAESTESSEDTTTTTARSTSSDVKVTLARAFKLAGVTTHQKPDTDPAYGR